MAPAHPPGCQCGDADAHVLLEGELNFLYKHVDRDKVVALNAEDGKEGKMVIKPWDQRTQEEEWLESDADEQLILRVPFTGNIKRVCPSFRSSPSLLDICRQCVPSSSRQVRQDTRRTRCKWCATFSLLFAFSLD